MHPLGLDRTTSDLDEMGSVPFQMKPSDGFLLAGSGGTKSSENRSTGIRFSDFGDMAADCSLFCKGLEGRKFGTRIALVVGVRALRRQAAQGSERPAVVQRPQQMRRGPRDSSEGSIFGGQ